MTLVLAVQRCRRLSVHSQSNCLSNCPDVYVCHPALAKVWCTVGQARLAVLATVSLAVLHMVPRTVDRQYTIIDLGTGERPASSLNHVCRLRGHRGQSASLLRQLHKPQDLHQPRPLFLHFLLVPSCVRPPRPLRGSRRPQLSPLRGSQAGGPET